MAAEPELAAFAADRLLAAPVAYLATVRADGRPRVHPVTPVLTTVGLYVFMEPTSPKGRDLRERRGTRSTTAWPDMSGSGGEVTVTGRGVAVDDAEVRGAAGGRGAVRGGRALRAVRAAGHRRPGQRLRRRRAPGAPQVVDRG